MDTNMNEEMYHYKVGQTIGLVHIVEGEVDWYKLHAVEIDEELGLLWLYLISDTNKLNDKSHPTYGRFAELIESTSSRIVVED